MTGSDTISMSTATMAQESSADVDSGHSADNPVPSPEDPGTSDHPDHTTAVAVETQEPVISQEATTLEPLESSEVESIEQGPGVSSDSTHVDNSTGVDHDIEVLPSTQAGGKEAQPESIEPVEPMEPDEDDPGDGAEKLNS